MLNSKIISILSPICSKAEVYPASKMDPNWEGVVMEINTIVAVIYPDQDGEWNVDIMSTENCDADVENFNSVYDAIGKIVSLYLEASSI